MKLAIMSFVFGIGLSVVGLHLSDWRWWFLDVLGFVAYCVGKSERK